MAAGRSPGKLPEKTEEAAHVIELSSDSEPDGPEVEDEVPDPASNSHDAGDQPLLRAAGIKYGADTANEEEQKLDQQSSPASAKLAVRVRDTGSAQHRHVSIEIPLPTSSGLRRRKAEANGAASQEEKDEDVFKTPKERKHITFDESDHDEFVTPREAPSRDPLESSIARPTEAERGTGKDADTAGRADKEEDEEESDDDAPPEAVSTRAAEVETLKVAEAAAKAAEQQAAALKRKRQERDAIFKQRAEERKRVQKPARQEGEPDDATPNTQEPTPGVAENRERKVPKLLPLELLESDDEDDNPRHPTANTNGKNKRRKLGGPEQSLLGEPKFPKDKRLGSTTYRVVAGSGDARLAPKVRKQVVSLKETLLRRDRVAQPKGGFFVRQR